MMRKIKLYNGDCMSVMDKLINKGVQVDAIICDPPYGTTACKWDNILPFNEMWERLNKLIKPNGAIVLFGSEPFSSALRMSNVKHYKYDWIWNKQLVTGHLNSKIMPMSRHENISVFNSKNKIQYYPVMENGRPEHSRGAKTNKMDSENYGRQNTNFIDKTGNTLKYPSTLSINIQKIHPSKCVHPTQKPVPLMEYIIKTYTNENEIVLDFTMGSGTTGIACKNLNRRFIGIELDEGYFKYAKQRIKHENI